ncbi:hypothetical protein [Endozoicomonas sp. GU-1]|uniref:hypothetical protein n=1 Tax=Endozoicomonas sp. GU-1 TaxID=3009078 RepID=UPI0022B3C709|nr:hypothetical protein [Endozoicomonas sp. GU-1]WBA83878.1 hypothetical protein O2T12_12525 [Endozoicomonas sp. GU-1]WBA86857.1 hypothetical protein O3276_02085 [Endozoicomonas sp. GU-1]
MEELKYSNGEVAMITASKIAQALHIANNSENENSNKPETGSFKNHLITCCAETTYMPASSNISELGSDSRTYKSMSNIALSVKKPATPPAAPPPPPIMKQPDTWAQIKRNISAEQKGKNKKHEKSNKEFIEELFERLKERRKETEGTERVLESKPRKPESQPVEPVRVAPKQIETVPVGPGIIPPPPPLPAVLSGKKVMKNDKKPPIAPKPVVKGSKLSPPQQFQMSQHVLESIKLKRTGRNLES